MANKRKKSYKKDTVNAEKAQAKLDELQTRYDEDDMIEDILIEMPASVKTVQEESGAVKPAAAVSREETDKIVAGIMAEAEKADTAEKPASVKTETAAREAVPDEEESPEYIELTAEISRSVKAAMEAKAAGIPPVKKAAADKTDNSGKPEKKAVKKSKKKEPELKPLKPILSIANIVYSAIAFGVITAAFLALPREGVSVTEQRDLAEFPEFSYESLMSGKYTNGITDYFNDNIPYRDELKKGAAFVRNLFGVNYNNAQIIGPVAVVTEEEEEEPLPAVTETEPVTAVPVTSAAPETTAKTTAASSVTEAVTTTAETTTTAPVTTTQPKNTKKDVNEIAPGVVTNGQVVTKLSDGHWWGISLFGGGKGTTFANAVNRFKAELGGGVNVWTMPAPTSGEFYLPDTYAQYNASHYKSVQNINSQLVDVTPVDCISALWDHTGEDIYLRTDHHWQPLGAYYAAKAFADAAGLPFADISTMERVDIPGYMGTMYGFTENADLLADPEVFTYYKPTNKYTTYYYDTAYNYTGQFAFFIPMPVNGSYSTFMGADNKIVRIKTDAGTGRKLVIFKDSYGNAEIPFYFGTFDEIWVCDMRYFDLNGVEFVKFTGATDLMFSCCTFSAVGANAKGLETILSNPVTVITETAG